LQRAQRRAAVPRDRAATSCGCGRSAASRRRRWKWTAAEGRPGSDRTAGR
jgi:hypothetical protein